MSSELDTRCINTIRVLAADTVEKAKSGHPGAPMGCAPIAHTLWGSVMKYSPQNPKWHNRDRFVLSNGHACALQYSMLHLTGYDLSIEDLKSFRQLHSKTPGHPENLLTPGIEVSTGPLGQGLSNAVGLAIAETHLAAKFNKPGFPIVDHFTYVLCGDGCLQEGITSEASSLAGHLKLGKLIVIYDDNLITIDGETELSFTEDVALRYQSYGWHVQTITDGNTDISGLKNAISIAQEVKDKPSLIKVRTCIGLGSKKQGTEAVHGSPLGEQDLKQVKVLYGFNPEESFIVPSEVDEFYKIKKAEGHDHEQRWNALFSAYSSSFPQEAEEYSRYQSSKLPQGFEESLPTYQPSDPAIATRQFSQQVLAKFAEIVPELIGGSADLTPSTLTKVKANSLDYSPHHPEGRYLRYGVREHAMSAICNGIAAHGGLFPFASTFFNFTGYALGAVRLSALSRFRVLYIMTHDSVGVGEDGPTHQPIEMLASVRSIPEMTVIRPADGNEVNAAYVIAANNHGPTFIVLSRQACANLVGSSIKGVHHGAYVLQSPHDYKLIIVATGSEVQLAVAAASLLAAEGIITRIVSFPCWELFEKQSQEYKDQVFTPGVPVLSVEAGATIGWEKYSHGQVGINQFGLSAPTAHVFKDLGLTKENVAAKAKQLLAFYADKPVPALLHRPF